MDAADTAHEAFLRARYFDALDGLRGLSILAVIWHHSGEHTGLLARGYLGVALFFAISGLLITTLLLREQDRSGTISLRGFYVRRTLRIFPLYYAVIAIYVLLVAVLERGSPAGTTFFANLPAYLTYTSNWFVDLSSGNRVIFYFAWSLATEEQFYLLWPSVVRYARIWFLPPIVMATLLLLGEASRWALETGLVPPDMLLARVVASVATPICLGCMAAYLLHRPAGFRAAWRVAGQWWSAPLATALLVLALAVEATPTALVALAMTCLVVACSIRPDHLLRHLLGWRALRYVGTISYGMYLLHMLSLNAARRLVPDAGAPLRFALAAAIAILLASVSYRWFERPILALKDRLSGRAVPQPVPAPSA
ncbi:MAG: acyltransferase [Deltaproteobacteria bacterium]|nr:acyltransferase [Deltaproteobacteria bacterium]